MTIADQHPLRIALLSYRSHPHCGGQGVYVRNLSHALHALGHQVEVISGPPYPELQNGLKLHRLPSLDLYNPNALFRTPHLNELCNPTNLLEWLGVSTMGFPEPLTFGIRARMFIKNTNGHFDVIHDNQCLSYGIGAIARRIPTVATIHHPITVDRDLAVRAERSLWRKIKQRRWYSFIGMQKRVAARLGRIITVSKCARSDISREFNISPDKFHVVPNGIDTDRFYPMAGVKRQPYRLIVTNSADTPLKGLRHLLLAIAELVSVMPELRLVIVGTPKKSGVNMRLIQKLGLAKHVRYTGPISHNEFVHQYARAWVAVTPSLYEGFGLPAGEAMACGVPVISTTGGALPEVVGDAGLLVPPADHKALAEAIVKICRDPKLAHAIGDAGYQRVMKHFTWKEAAKKSVAAYRQTIHAYRRL